MHPTDVRSPSRTVCFDMNRLTIADIVSLAEGYGARQVYPTSRHFARSFAAAPTSWSDGLREEGSVYGVTTGYGDSCTVAVAPELVAELPRHLYTFHGCGLGKHFSPMETRAVIAARLASLCKGFSGVRVELLEQLAHLLRARHPAGYSQRRLRGRQRRSHAAVLRCRSNLRRG